MFIKKYFKKRTVLVSSLVMLLMVMGYLNNQLTKSALRQSTRGYEEHQEVQLSKIREENDKEVMETASKNIEVVESTDSTDGEKTKDEKKSKYSENYFVEHRLSRDKTRGETVERLNKIIEDENTKDDVRSNAQTELIELGETSELELLLEGLVKGKGFKDVVVFSTNENTSIVVDQEKLSEQDVMKILEIVTSETELQAQDIKIMNK